MQTDDGAVAAGSTEITAETIAEELSEEESFRDFITQTHAEDYEAQEGWYRWTYTVKEIDVDRILETLKNRYEANGKLILTLKDGDYSSQSIKNFSKVTDITIVNGDPAVWQMNWSLPQIKEPTRSSRNIISEQYYVME